MTKTDQNMNYQNMLSISVIWQSSIICKLFVAFSVAVRFVFSLLSTRQKQPPEVFYRKWSSWKFRKIHGKILVPESLFKWSCRPSARKFIKRETPRSANLFKKINYGTGYLLWILQNFQEHLFLQNTSGGYFLTRVILCCNLSFQRKMTVYFSHKTFVSADPTWIKIFEIFSLLLFVKYTFVL